MHGWWAASYVVLWLLVVALSFLVIALARQVGTLHLRLGPTGAYEADDEGPPLGQSPPPAEERDADGHIVTIGGPGEAQFLLFVSPGCRVCAEVTPGLKAAARGGGLAPFLITDDLSNDDKLARFGVPVVASSQIAATYNVPGTPFAVILDDDGLVRAKGTVNNLEQMEGLVDTADKRIRELGVRR